jgi:YedE family putative selenium metabolism protein
MRWEQKHKHCGNLFITGSFHLGFEGQPIAHTNHLFNFLGLGLVGLTGVLLGGCPIRQTVLSGEGDSDAMIVVLGLIVGTAFAHNFGLAASGDGVPVNGQIATVIGYIVVLALATLITMQANRKGA